MRNTFLNWVVLLLSMAGLVFLILARANNAPAQFFGIGVIVLSVLYFLRFELEFAKKLIYKFKNYEIPVPITILRWIRQEGWFYIITLTVVNIAFLSLGLIHLGAFMSVDEPKWLNTRVPQLYDALLTREWENTYINDKPGVLPSSLAGITNFFISKSDYGPDNIEHYLFWWRFPILLFNFITLFFVYHFVKKLFNKNIALLTTVFIALHPIIIGISQIVNPDATLWNTGFLSFIAFFLYLTSNQKKYIFYSGFFLGLALISKYFITIFYVVFFLAIYLEYLINETDKSQFFQHLQGTLKIYLVSMVTYTLLFPVTWIYPGQIIEGTVGADILSPGRTIILALVFLVLFELLAVKGRFTLLIKNRVDVGALILRIVSMTFLVAISFLLINLFMNYYFFDPQEYKLLDYERKEAQFVPALFASGYIALFTLSLPLLIGLCVFSISTFVKKILLPKKYDLILMTILLTIIIFVAGAAMGGFVISARYQIILYPLYALLAAVLYLKIFKFEKPTIITLALFVLITAVNASPFYIHYTNLLNFKNTTTMNGWGYGGYELAQLVNGTLGSKKMVVWSDREGFNEFYLGESFWRGKNNPFESSLGVKYLILSNDGEKIFQRALKKWREGQMHLYAREAVNTPILDYYKKEPLAKFCINNNPDYCTWIVKMDANDLQPPENQPDEL